MIRQQKWEFRYETPSGEKVCYPNSKEKVEESKKICEKNGYKVISVKKLYPFSLLKNQHNFNLISDICFNRMHDMIHGEVEWDDEEFEYLEKLKDRADYYYGLPMIAWLPYDEWSEANEIAQMAITHREQACIKAGRIDLLKYCD